MLKLNPSHTGHLYIKDETAGNGGRILCQEVTGGGIGRALPSRAFQHEGKPLPEICVIIHDADESLILHFLKILHFRSPSPGFSFTHSSSNEALRPPPGILS